MINQPLYIFIHIHKCAGVTISNHLIEKLPRGKYLGIYQLENRSFVNSYIKLLPNSSLAKLKVIMGHGAYFGLDKIIGRECKYITFLREPIERTISNYAYFVQDVRTGKNKRKSVIKDRSDIYEISEWIKVRKDMHDYMTRFLYHNFFYKKIAGEVTADHLKSVMAVLKKFYQVGIVESYFDDAFLYSSLNIPVVAKRQNITDKKYLPESFETASIKKYVSKDLVLYNYFRSHKIPELTIPTKLKLFSLKILSSYVS